MSTTKIINGCAIDNGQSVFFAQSDERPTAPWQPATLYIGTGKLWTEEELRAMFRDLMHSQASADVANGWQCGAVCDFAGIAAKRGLTL